LNSFIDVAIIGAGPNGLSLGAHLAAQGVEFRIFGKPMELWRDRMPPGMRLKSDGKSSNLADPDDEFTLGNYCAQERVQYDDALIPIKLDTFVKYGMAFQRRFVPQVEEKMLTALEARGDRFALRFDDGEIVMAKRVVLAVGISHFSYVPEFLCNLPEEFVSHSSCYGDLGRFRGKEVTVLGAGASALDLAGLLKDYGSEVSVLARRRSIVFHAPPPGPRRLVSRLRSPDSGMGGGWELFIFGSEPRVFHALPRSVRRRKARTMLGPSTGWFMRESIIGRVPIETGVTPNRAEVKNGSVHIIATGPDGSLREIVTPHVIAATGYRVDLRRLGFLSPNMLARIKEVEQAPVLSTRFETSIPGLYMVGFAAVNDFGPLVRFVLGARYQARRLSSHLAVSTRSLRKHATISVGSLAS
jgi:Pyridine nucleotide-disulphide oxidoreductase